MHIKSLFYRILEAIYKFFRKDTMEIKLKRYRLYGAQIGKRVRAFSPICSAEPYLIHIGADTTISTGVKFITHDNAIKKCVSKGTDLVGPITIGEHCFIGLNTILLPGITIANNCIVGAGSVVTSSFLQENVVIAGNPAKTIGTIENYRDKNIENMFDFSQNNKDERREKIINNPEKWLIRDERKLK